MPEGSRGRTANPLGYARVGSNPIVCDSGYMAKWQGSRLQIGRSRVRITLGPIWGCSSIGRALALHARGRRIETAHLQLIFLRIHSTAVSLNAGHLLRQSLMYFSLSDGAYLLCFCKFSGYIQFSEFFITSANTRKYSSLSRGS